MDHFTGQILGKMDIPSLQLQVILVHIFSYWVIVGERDWLLFQILIAKCIKRKICETGVGYKGVPIRKPRAQSASQVLLGGEMGKLNNVGLFLYDNKPGADRIHLFKVCDVGFI